VGAGPRRTATHTRLRAKVGVGLGGDPFAVQETHGPGLKPRDEQSVESRQKVTANDDPQSQPNAESKPEVVPDAPMSPSSDEADAQALLGVARVDGEYLTREADRNFETKEIRQWETKDGPIGQRPEQEPQPQPESPRQEQ
jgi:hypothetical protein